VHSAKSLEEQGPKSDAARNVEILREHLAKGEGTAPRKIRLLLLTSPTEVIGDEQGRVKAVKMERNELVAREDGSLSARGTGQFETLERVGIVFPSIGYRGIPVEGVPFHEKWGVIPNADGRVTEMDGTAHVGEYVVGWMRNGPQGLIGMHRQASGEVVTAMLEDVAGGKITGPSKDIAPLLEERGVKFVTFEDWKRLDALEVENGKTRGAVRMKYTQIPEMMKAIGKG
jgi:ferredoxin--NADP+ reductase